MSGPVTQYGAAADGTRACGFDLGRLFVLVRPNDAGDNGYAHGVALQLAGALATIELQRAEIAAMQAKLPPPEPARLLARGFVRFTSAGQMWLLSKRERGFGHFGVWLDGWDNLFRCYNVRVVEHGQDEHGLWWAVENAGEVIDRTKAGVP